MEGNQTEISHRLLTTSPKLLLSTELPLLNDSSTTTPLRWKSSVETSDFMADDGGQVLGNEVRRKFYF